jgi:hypothetical protein
MAIRKITIKEAFVYDILEKHSSGRRFNFCWERFEWDEARFKYRSWNRARLLGAFNVYEEMEICRKEVPELLPELQTLKEAMENLKNAQDKFEGCRIRLIEKGKSLCKDPQAVHRAYDILTPQEVEFIEQNKDKKGELEAELSKLTLQLEVLPQKGYRKERAELKSQISDVKYNLSLLQG